MVRYADGTQKEEILGCIFEHEFWSCPRLTAPKQNSLPEATVSKQNFMSPETSPSKQNVDSDCFGTPNSGLGSDDQGGKGQDPPDPPMPQFVRTARPRIRVGFDGCPEGQCSHKQNNGGGNPNGATTRPDATTDGSAGATGATPNTGSGGSEHTTSHERKPEPSMSNMCQAN